MWQDNRAESFGNIPLDPAISRLSESFVGAGFFLSRKGEADRQQINSIQEWASPHRPSGALYRYSADGEQTLSHATQLLREFQTLETVVCISPPQLRARPCPHSSNLPGPQKPGQMTSPRKPFLRLTGRIKALHFVFPKLCPYLPKLCIICCASGLKESEPIQKVKES